MKHTPNSSLHWKKLFVITCRKRNMKDFFSDMSEVVSDIPMPPDSFFGKQMPVETALFRDVWNIVGD